MEEYKIGAFHHVRWTTSLKDRPLFGGSTVLCWCPSQVAEKVDARDLRMGAWFEAEVVKVTAETPPTSNGTVMNGHTSNGSVEPTIYYHVKFDE